MRLILILPLLACAALLLNACGGGGGINIGVGGGRGNNPQPRVYPDGLWTGQGNDAARVTVVIENDGSFVLAEAAGGHAGLTGQLAPRADSDALFDVTFEDGTRGFVLASEGPEPGSAHLVWRADREPLTFSVLERAPHPAGLLGYELRDLRPKTWRGTMVTSEPGRAVAADPGAASLTVDALDRVWGTLAPGHAIVPDGDRGLVDDQARRWWIQVRDVPTGEDRMVLLHLAPRKRAVAVLSWIPLAGGGSVDVRIGLLLLAGDH